MGCQCIENPVQKYKKAHRPSHLVGDSGSLHLDDLNDGVPVCGMAAVGEFLSRELHECVLYARQRS